MAKTFSIGRGDSSLGRANSSTGTGVITGNASRGANSSIAGGLPSTRRGKPGIHGSKFNTTVDGFSKMTYPTTTTAPPPPAWYELFTWGTAEDFTTWVQGGTNGVFTVAADQITMTNHNDTNNGDYVVKDLGSEILGEFALKFKCYAEVTENAAYVFFPLLLVNAPPPFGYSDTPQVYFGLNAYTAGPSYNASMIVKYSNMPSQVQESASNIPSQEVTFVAHHDPTNRRVRLAVLSSDETTLLGEIDSEPDHHNYYDCVWNQWRYIGIGEMFSFYPTYAGTGYIKNLQFAV